MLLPQEEREEFRCKEGYCTESLNNYRQMCAANLQLELFDGLSMAEIASDGPVITVISEVALQCIEGNAL